MWNKTIIKLEDTSKLREQGLAMIKAGNPLVEQIRCVFTLQDDPIIYMYPLLDYVDLNIEKDFTSFQIYQFQAQ